MTKKRFLAGATLAVSLSVVSALLLSEREETAVAQAATSSQPPEALVMSVLTRDVVPTAEFTGHLAAVDTVELRPRVSGYIESVHVPEGALVTQGQLLFTIDAAPLKAGVDAASARVAEAEARVSLAAKDVVRAKTLFEKGWVSRARLDQLSAIAAESRAQLASARAAETSARLQLSYTKVVAPISGRVGHAGATRGNLISASADAKPLTSIVSVDPLYAYFDVDETTYLSALASDRRGALRVDVALADGTAASGLLDFVSNRVDSATGTARVRAVISNPSGRLTPGLFVRARLVTGPAQPKALVHDHAIRADQGSRYVLVADAAGKLAYRTVKLGGLEGDLRIVTEGLRPGEHVVVKGLVGPGMMIRPRVLALRDMTPSANNR